eukprot:GILK01007348.1.p1 GENE.GILK01007348.1~~GILK01007348.1.p1  ORF type:complete len:1211 (-),score=220.22 GILK01007348.1:88-3720(-)
MDSVEADVYPLVPGAPKQPFIAVPEELQSLYDANQNDLDVFFDEQDTGICYFEERRLHPTPVRYSKAKRERRRESALDWNVVAVVMVPLILFAVLLSFSSYMFSGQRSEAETFVPRGLNEDWSSWDSCDPLGSSSSTGSVYQLKTQTAGSHSIIRSLPFRLEKSLAMWQGYLPLLDQSNAVETVSAVNLLGYDVNYESSRDAARRLGGDLFMPLTVDFQRLYRERFDVSSRSFVGPYTEQKKRLSFSSYNPTWVHTDGNHTVWEEQVTLNSALVYTVRLYSNDLNFLRSLPIDTADSPYVKKERVHPGVCGRYVIYQEMNWATVRSSIWLYNIDTATSQALTSTSSSATSSHVLPQLVSVSNSENGKKLCVASWIETAETVSSGEDGYIVPSSTTWMSTAKLHVLELPSWRATALSAADFAPASNPSLTSLFNFLVTDRYVWISLVDSTSSLYGVRAYHFGTAVWTDFPYTISTEPLYLQSASQSHLLYWQKSSATEQQLLMIKLVEGTSLSYKEAHCRLLVSNSTVPVTAVALNEGMVVWKQDLKSDNTQSLFIFNLNKDNDLLFDVNDAFPLDGDSYWDSDNDGIGDAADIVTATGACVTSGRPKDCVDDVTVLYSVFGSFVFVAIVFHYLFARAHRIYKLKHQGDTNEMTEQAVQKELNDVELRGLCSFKSERVLYLFQLGSELHEGLMVMLAAASAILTIVPFFQTPSQAPLPYVLQQAFWTEWFISYMFLHELVVEGFTRDLKQFPSIFSFIRSRWTDILSIFTEVPGAVWTTGPWVVIKVFRLIRLYSRLVRTQFFVTLMVTRVVLFTTLFIGACMIASSVIFKIFEQETNQPFENFFSVVWFSAVTVATVGYGDMVPTSIVARIVAVLLMMIGIGLISTLSANTVVRMLRVGKVEDKVEELKKNLSNRWISCMTGQAQLSVPYNPLMAVFYRQSPLQDSQRLATVAAMHESSCLNVTVGMDRTIELPVDEVLKGAGGKFRVNDMTSSAEMIKRLRKQQAESCLLDAALTATASDPHPMTRLRYTLKLFNVDQVEKGGVKNFEELCDEMADVVFENNPRNGHFLEKIFTMHHDVSSSTQQHSATPSYRNYTFQDPIALKFHRMEETLLRYGLVFKLDYHELVQQLKTLILMHERVTTASWALEHLTYAQGTVIPGPKLAHVIPPRSHLPNVDVLLTDFTTFHAVPRSSLGHRGSARDIRRTSRV